MKKKNTFMTVCKFCNSSSRTTEDFAPKVLNIEIGARYVVKFFKYVLFYSVFLTDLDVH
jgi:hypothetical protein